MGFCLLSEIILDCLLCARDKYLVPGGLMFPDKASLYIAGIEDAERMSGKVDCKYYSWLRI
jgi:type I protein arginine methyltransferase